MKIYLLKRRECGWDEYSARVIIAKNEQRAREIANENIGYEGQIWADASRVTCKIVEKKIEGEVLASFRAG